MNTHILDLAPENLWKHFYALTQIPRPSKQEAEVVRFIKNFGEGLALDTTVDTAGNVIIRKPATPGMGDCQGIILQGHLDMVPQKNSGTLHNFAVDPIDAYVDGEWVTARGTTLGADNGIGVAAAMAVLEGTELRHGPLEALFTVDEETGMTGALALQPGTLRGDILLNLDSEDEGDLYIGCAGGVDTNVQFKCEQQRVAMGSAAFKISLQGLRGGHSGLDIHLGRGNACLIMNSVLQAAARTFGLRLSAIEAGNLRNAIPREAFANVVVPQVEREGFLRFIGEEKANLQRSLHTSDPDAVLSCEEVDLPEYNLDSESQTNLFGAVADCPNGVIARIEGRPEVVETSSNLASLRSEGGTVSIACLTRSAVNAERDAVARRISEVFHRYNARVEQKGAYPGWQPDSKSPILSTMKRVYKEKFGTVPEQKIIHAGLECGILGATYPHWDMISFGPTIRNPHSPGEKVHIKSVNKFWDYLLATLEKAPAR